MGFFNRDYRCFDNDSIDTAAMMENIFESSHNDNRSAGICSGTDPWEAGNSFTTSNSMWDTSDDQ